MQIYWLGARSRLSESVVGIFGCWGRGTFRCLPRLLTHTLLPRRVVTKADDHRLFLSVKKDIDFDQLTACYDGNLHALPTRNAAFQRPFKLNR